MVTEYVPKFSKATGLKFPPKDPATGLYLSHGNGCKYHNNCFTCPIPPDKCHWNDYKDNWREE